MEEEYNKESERRQESIRPKVKRQMTSTQLRNLHEYKNLSDDDMEERIIKLNLGVEISREWEIRIAVKWKDYEENYDLTDLKPNDLASLRALIVCVLRLDDYESEINKLTVGGVSEGNILVIEKLGKLMEGLRNDISNLQRDLNISRKLRRGDQEVSVIAYISKLKESAKKFWDKKSLLIFCPRCKTLIFHGWFLYPESKQNKIQLFCKHILENGESCGELISITTKELQDMGGSNMKDLVPESVQ